MEYASFAERIIYIKNVDLKLREKLLKNGQLEEGYNEEMEKVHNQNANELNVIIDTIGYPTIEKVGKDASEAAWLIIQHSIGKPEFMKKCKVLLERAVASNKANPKNLAYLSDRIAIFEGKTQLYGTQFDWDENGEMNPQKIDDLAKVNQRRKSIGLNTLEEQTTIMRQQVINEKQLSPSKFKKKKKNFEEWRKKVGWIK